MVNSKSTDTASQQSRASERAKPEPLYPFEADVLDITVADGRVSIDVQGSKYDEAIQSPKAQGYDVAFSASDIKAAVAMDFSEEAPQLDQSVDALYTAK